MLTKAGQAKNTSEKATEKEKIHVEVMGAYDNRGKLVAKQIKQNINKNITDASVEDVNVDSFPIKVTYNNGHKYVVSANGTIYLGDEYDKYDRVIPDGFTILNDIEGKNLLEKGLIVKDENENEWVWIEVPNDGTGPIYPSNATDTQIEIALREYCSDIISIGTNSNDYNRKSSTYGYLDTWYNGCGLDKNEYDTTKSTMLQSIKKNGGFFIGRYETGYFSDNVYSDYNSSSREAVIKRDAYPYNYVTCSQAETLAKEFATTGKTTSLLFGIQWDLVLKYINEKGIKNVSELIINSTTWGNYNNNSNINGTFNITSERAKKSESSPYCSWSVIEKGTIKSGEMLLTTGSSTTLAPLEIYDFAGNVWEWTLEKTSYSGSPCTNRGGLYADGGDVCPVSFRGSGGDTNFLRNDIGFRVSLY